MKCIAIDDEPLALTIISKFCERQGNLDIETFCDPDEGMARIAATSPDIVFLDVEMNETSGLSLASRLPEGCCLIFTTAHAQYALDGFDLNAVDFLHKPFSYERFQQAVAKATRQIEDARTLLQVRSLPAEDSPLSGSITLVSEYRNINFPLDQISYVQALGNYTKVFTTDGKNTLTHTNMKTLLQQLPEEHFIRIHRSYLVSIREIGSYNRSSVRMKGSDKTLPVGNQFARSFQERMATSPAAH